MLSDAETPACAPEPAPPGSAKPSLLVAAKANTPAAPNCFRNDRLVLSFQSMSFSPSSSATRSGKQMIALGNIAGDREHRQPFSERDQQF
jgi:hypothetical protein